MTNNARNYLIGYMVCLLLVILGGSYSLAIAKESLAVRTGSTLIEP